MTHMEEGRTVLEGLGTLRPWQGKGWSSASKLMLWRPPSPHLACYRHSSPLREGSYYTDDPFPLCTGKEIRVWGPPGK